MIVDWKFRIPEPDDGCHISVWFRVEKGKWTHAITYHVFYIGDEINPVVEILEKLFPGETITFKRLEKGRFEVND